MLVFSGYHETPKPAQLVKTTGTQAKVTAVARSGEGLLSSLCVFPWASLVREDPNPSLGGLATSPGAGEVGLTS